MPAKAGIQVRSRSKFKNRLDSGFRRKDGIRVDFQSTNSEPLGLEPRVVQFRAKSKGRQGMRSTDKTGNSKVEIRDNRIKQKSKEQIHMRIVAERHAVYKTKA